MIFIKQQKIVPLNILNNLIEQYHRPIKRYYKFYRNFRTASTTFKNMETIRELYKTSQKEDTLFDFSVCTEIKTLLGEFQHKL